MPAGRYQLDPHHWNVSFDVDHFHYSRFVMRFDKVTGQLDWGADDMTGSSVRVSIDAASVNTNVPRLDRMVKAQTCSIRRTIRRSTSSTHRSGRTGDDKGTLTGNLTIRGTTRPVTLNVTFNGHAVNPLTKQETLGFSANGHFKPFAVRTDDVVYPAVGDEVYVAIQAEFAKAPASQWNLLL